MSSEILQVRDVPSEDARVLRERAAARNVSLSSYLRDLIHDEASRPLMAEILQRIASRASVETSSDATRSFIDDGRR